VFHTRLFLIAFHFFKALFHIWVGTRLFPLFCGWSFKTKTFVDRPNNSVFLWVALEWNLFFFPISIFFSIRFPSFSFQVVFCCPSFLTTMVFNTNACPNPMSKHFWNPHFNTLHHTYCTLQHTATHCNTLQITATSTCHVKHSPDHKNLFKQHNPPRDFANRTDFFEK